MPLDVVDPKGAVVKLGDLAKQSPENVDIRGGRIVRLAELSADKGDIKALKAKAASIEALEVSEVDAESAALESLVVTGNSALGDSTSDEHTVSGSWTANESTARGHRNIIIGGDFSTNPWQNGTSFAAAAHLTWLADRFRWIQVSTAVVTVDRGGGFNDTKSGGRAVPNSLRVDVTTADAAVAAADFASVRYVVEGYDWAYVAQRACVISLWHSHTKVGTYCIGLRNTGLDRSLVLEYGQAVADAWEYAESRIPASPSAGTWDYVNGVGAYIDFVLMAGTNWHGAAGSWASSNIIATSNQINALDSTANFCRFALIQLEPGTKATAFDYRSRQSVIADCQRYNAILGNLTQAEIQVRGYGIAGDSLASYVPFKVPMRATPTLTQIGTFTVGNMGQPSPVGLTENGFHLTSAITATGSGYCLSETNAYYQARAELG